MVSTYHKTLLARPYSSIAVRLIFTTLLYTGCTAMLRINCHHCRLHLEEGESTVRKMSIQENCSNLWEGFSNLQIEEQNAVRNIIIQDGLPMGTIMVAKLDAAWKRISKLLKEANNTRRKPFMSQSQFNQIRKGISDAYIAAGEIVLEYLEHLTFESQNKLGIECFKLFNALETNWSREATCLGLQLSYDNQLANMCQGIRP